MHNSISNQTIDVSFLICTHLPSDALYDAIDSCLQQSYHSFEIVVIANGSMASSLYSMIKSFYKNQSIVRVFSSSIYGLTYNLNYGISKCRGSFIARLDADDFCFKDRLEKQMNYLHAHPDIDVLGTQYLVSPDKGSTIDSVSNLPIHHFILRLYLYFSNPICHPSVIYKKNVLLQCGGYAGSEHQEDYDLWVRLMLSGDVRLGNLSDICIVYNSIGIGDSRGNLKAYSGVASTQMRAFLLSFNPLWLFGFVVTFSRIIILRASALIPFYRPLR